MIDLALFQSVSYIAGALGVCIAAIYYVMNIRVQQTNTRNALDTRRAQMYMQYWDKINTEEWQNDLNELLEKWTWTDFDDFLYKYGPEDSPDQWRKYMKIVGYYEHIGVLANEGLIDPKLIYAYDHNPIRIWEKYEPIILEWRQRFEPPPKGMIAEWFEDLYYVLYEIRAKDRVDLGNRLAKRKRMREALKLRAVQPRSQ